MCQIKQPVVFYLLFSLLLLASSVTLYSQEATLDSQYQEQSPEFLLWVQREVARVVKKYPEVMPLLLKLANELDRIATQSKQAKMQYDLELSTLRQQVATLQKQEVTREVSQKLLEVAWNNKTKLLNDIIKEAKSQRDVSIIIAIGSLIGNGVQLISSK